MMMMMSGGEDEIGDATFLFFNRDCCFIAHGERKKWMLDVVRYAKLRETRKKRHIATDSIDCTAHARIGMEEERERHGCRRVAYRC
jgi:hypothetical protein